MDKMRTDILVNYAMLDGSEDLPKDLDKIGSAVHDVAKVAEKFAHYEGPVRSEPVSVGCGDGGLRDDTVKKEHSGMVEESSYFDSPYVSVPRVV